MTVVTITVVTVFKNDFLIDTFDDIDASSDSFGISNEIILYFRVKSFGISNDS